MRAFIGFMITVLGIVTLGTCGAYLLPFFLLGVVTMLFKGSGQSSLSVRQPKW